MLSAILEAFNISPKAAVTSFGTGLINNTWKVEAESGTFILQRINISIFKKPFAIADNIEAIGSYLHKKEPAYLFPLPVTTKTGSTLFEDAEKKYYRLVPFIANSHSVDVLQNPSQAYEAAQQFGKFTRLLSGFNAANLKTTLPDFHNLSLRYKQFEKALVNGNSQRITESDAYIQQLKKYSGIADTYEYIKANPSFKLRVTHHDTKISNVLFDDTGKGLCVIDLDTVMPGYFISDVGDMMRTYLSPVSEEEQDFSKIEIRPDFFEALAKGYLSNMKEELTKEELEHFVYAGKFMIYMQSLRFLTDYINNDLYYGAKYETHNFIRAGNQLTLLQKLIAAENNLTAVLSSFC